MAYFDVSPWAKMAPKLFQNKEFYHRPVAVVSAAGCYFCLTGDEALATLARNSSWMLRNSVPLTGEQRHRTCMLHNFWLCYCCCTHLNMPNESAHLACLWYRARESPFVFDVLITWTSCKPDSQCFSWMLESQEQRGLCFGSLGLCGCVLCRH